MIQPCLSQLALLCLLLCVFLGEGLCSASALEVPSIVGDRMVLQRDQPLPIWSWAEPGAEVEVRFADGKSSAVAGTDGRREVGLPPSPASEEGRALTIRSGNEVLRFQTTGALEAGPGMLTAEWQVSGADGQWHDAPTEITASEIGIRVPDAVEGPLRVRYAWQNWTARAVRDGGGLPLAPFVTEPLP